MSRALPLWLIASLVACTSQFLPGRCDKTSDCVAGQTCNLDRTLEGNGRCVAITAPDGAADGSDANAEGPPDAKSDAPKACTAASCSGAAAPICDSASKVCRGCASASDCTMLSAAAPVCAPSGACVECAVSSQCGAAGKPICDTTTSACRGCGSGAECAAASAATPACASSGKCVECVANTDCKSATKPICDMGMGTCRGCQADAECTAGPQVCMKHQDGRCATDAETIYVQKTAACPGAAATADGTAALPYCSMDPALGAVGATRDLIVVRGTVSGAATGLTSGARQTSIVGQMSAALAGATDPAFHLVTGDAYLRNVTLSASASIGCQADAGSTLRLDHVLVTGNTGGGILLNGAAFDIENTTVTNNGPGTQGTTIWGGILVNSPLAAGPGKFQLVTVRNNLAPGILCSAGVAGIDVMAAGNSTTDISLLCGFVSCGTASTTCGAQP
jgi:hypothetical protein